VDIYDLIGYLLFPSLKIQGVIIEAAQTMVEGARFGTYINRRTDAQREELLNDLEWWIKQAETFAEADHWPMNRAACTICQFNGVCSAEPARRETLLRADFTKRHWNPLENR